MEVSRILVIHTQSQKVIYVLSRNIPNLLGGRGGGGHNGVSDVLVLASAHDERRGYSQRVQSHHGGRGSHSGDVTGSNDNTLRFSKAMC